MRETITNNSVSWPTDRLGARVDPLEGVGQQLQRGTFLEGGLGEHAVPEAILTRLVTHTRTHTRGDQVWM